MKPARNERIRYALDDFGYLLPVLREIYLEGLPIARRRAVKRVPHDVIDYFTAYDFVLELPYRTTR